MIFQSVENRSGFTFSFYDRENGFDIFEDSCKFFIGRSRVCFKR